MKKQHQPGKLKLQGEQVASKVFDTLCNLKGSRFWVFFSNNQAWVLFCPPSCGQEILRFCPACPEQNRLDLSKCLKRGRTNRAQLTNNDPEDLTQKVRQKQHLKEEEARRCQGGLTSLKTFSAPPSFSKSLQA